MSQENPSKIIKHSIEKWGKDETNTLIEFIQNISISIENIDKYKLIPENEPKRSCH